MALNRSNWLLIQRIEYKQKASEMFQNKTVKILMPSYGFVQLPVIFHTAKLVAYARNLLNFLETGNLHFLFLTKNHLNKQPRGQYL